MHIFSVVDLSCRLCPRLVSHLEEIRKHHPAYHARPVGGCGDPHARLVIVGLAPGLHGANATGRPFTGDYAGVLLYRTLYRFGFSNQESATSLDDGLDLQDCWITNAVKCLPPANKPIAKEIQTCSRFLKKELALLRKNRVILSLGRVAHDAVLRSLVLKSSHYPFGHGRLHHLPQGGLLLNSYHSSRYNIHTKRLTESMFVTIFEQIKDLLSQV